MSTVSVLQPAPAAPRRWAVHASRPLTLYLGLAAVGSYLLLLVVLPVGSVIRMALVHGWPGFWHPLTDPLGRAALGLSVTAGLLAAGINTAAGTAVAFALVRGRFPGRRLLDTLLDLPLGVPTTVSGLMLLLLYSPVSPIGAWLAARHLAVAYAPAGVVLAMAFVTLPYAVRTVQPVLAGLDRRMEEAAWTLGASRWRTLREVVLPMVWPGIASGFCLTFSRAMAEFGSVVVISGNLPGQTLVAPVYLYGLLENDDPFGAAAMSVDLLLIALAAHAVAAWLEHRHAARLRGAGAVAGGPGQGAPVSPTARASARPAAGRQAVLHAGRLAAALARRIGRWAAAGVFTWVWLGVMLLLPLAGLISGALQAGVAGFVQSLAQPEAVASLRLSAVVTAWTVLFNVVFGLWTATLLTKHRFPGRWLVSAVADLPFALSPVIAGLALLLVYGPNTGLGQWLQAHGIHVVFALPGMVMASLLVTYPLVVRELVPALQLTGRAAEEAAYTLGASRWRTFVRVTLPSIRWSLYYAVVLTVARSLGEFGAVLVVSGNLVGVTQTAPLYVYQATVEHNMAAADAVSLILASASFVMLLFMQFLRRKGGLAHEH
ncbi:hypothetical protein GCM10010885_18500 [Alicyclobacillus cellulosilyticus]|uniref:ABC transmembrane type-1 domain-containing protein n=1 Tax=Alicyclobacillus cellulosilyticus TaxID=1003997 RepID=A0A917KF89_9BACL|nr:sulfate ABC transporter permease subunit [Alicyclobacillus cellulosilyticus]GGJ09707.1 hypothetical protein GCM10010885_18500 [Alicyclobacillus cellulosilyticus]